MKLDAAVLRGPRQPLFTLLFVCFHQQKMFTPPMPGDVMVNFYINLSKLCLTVYQLHVLPPNTTKVGTL